MAITASGPVGITLVDAVHACMDWGMIWVVALSGCRSVVSEQRVKEALTESHGILEQYVVARTQALEVQREILHAITECHREGVVVVDQSRKFVVSNSVGPISLKRDR
jgi:transcriptional regulator with PAS, ATPase and Fis domain